jgi:MoaA/NifB/PqqE/SkfB family radical SAM enzyme
MELKVLYRGPLSSCNYGCDYCPFAKRSETRAELASDEGALVRFSAFVAEARAHRFGLLFTPWGEGLVRRWYREALVALSRLEHVDRVAIQTNLATPLDWLGLARAERVGLWATYHPEWTTREKFLAQVRRADAAGARISVGVVGFPRFADEIAALRRELPAHIYLWINAVKSGAAAPLYSPATLASFTAIDPLFGYNRVAHASAGRPCRAGESVFSVDGAGDMRRCHFIATRIGNIYEAGWERALARRDCSNATCGCHIGYVHLEYLELDKVFGAGILERVPGPHVWPGNNVIQSP